MMASVLHVIIGAAYSQAGGSRDHTPGYVHHKHSGYCGARMTSGGSKGWIKSPISLCVSEDVAKVS